MKDNFSAQSAKYAKFRPSYPPELYNFLLSNINEKLAAWDCATGNGQVAIELAKHFQEVQATDISVKQLSEAQQLPNIFYKVESAEHTAFADDQFDLITVAQAIHWLNFDDFFSEIKRVLKPNGLFAAFGYGLMKINPEVDVVIHRLYEDILGNYWDVERKHIEDNYARIPFPFAEIESPTLTIDTQWNFDQLIGYLETWSALQHYLKANEKNPIELVYDDLKLAWGDGDQQKTVKFPIILKTFKI